MNDELKEATINNYLEYLEDIPENVEGDYYHYD